MCSVHGKSRQGMTVRLDDLWTAACCNNKNDNTLILSTKQRISHKHFGSDEKMQDR